MFVWINVVELLTECPPPPPPHPHSPPSPPPSPPSRPLHPPPSPLTVGFDFNGLHRGTDAHTTASEAPKQVCGTMANRWAPSRLSCMCLMIIVSSQHVCVCACHSRAAILLCFLVCVCSHAWHLALTPGISHMLPDHT